MPIRVLLVDDHTMFREALCLMLAREPEVEVVGELGNGSQVLQTVARLLPDVLVIDISMPEVNGIQATRQVRAQFPQVHVVALSAFNYQKFVMEMMEAGATAYVVKSAAGDQLLQAIKSAAQGKIFLCPEATATLIEASRRGHKGSMGPRDNKRLGRRETEVLRLLADGLTSPQIAEELHIATSTVDVHRRNIMFKLDLHNVAELTKYAIRTGLTSV
ncbi:response regulator transcription factor [Rhodoferax sp. PAMC 29310]|uniref:response regulator n=1 Tax=Rhodoferax sp. PAMC 29310 TaxID=2822760 RepID=UPI001B332F78|nr:response regulator transcription factor [Rhodoferax sp. PAMC 29310]